MPKVRCIVKSVRVYLPFVGRTTGVATLVVYAVGVVPAAFVLGQFLSASPCDCPAPSDCGGLRILLMVGVIDWGWDVRGSCCRGAEVGGCWEIG